MPGRSMYSRTICPPTTCSTTRCSTRSISIRLYRAVAPRGPGSVAKPLPRPVGPAFVGRISRTSTFGPWVQRPKQLCHSSWVCSRAPCASRTARNASWRAAEPRRSPHSGPRQIRILKRRTTGSESLTGTRRAVNPPTREAMPQKRPEGRSKGDRREVDGARWASHVRPMCDPREDRAGDRTREVELSGIWKPVSATTTSWIQRYSRFCRVRVAARKNRSRICERRAAAPVGSSRPRRPA